MVELLAVIIILAIVVGITIPAVLTTTSKAKEKSFETVAKTTADWFDRQYEIYRSGVDSLGTVTVNSTFITACGEDASLCLIGKNEDNPTMGEVALNEGPEYNNGDGVIEGIGIDTKNISSLFVVINPETGRSCVHLIAARNGDYYTTREKSNIQGGDCS